MRCPLLRLEADTAVCSRAPHVGFEGSQAVGGESFSRSAQCRKLATLLALRASPSRAAARLRRMALSPGRSGRTRPARFRDRARLPHEGIGAGESGRIDNLYDQCVVCARHKADVHAQPCRVGFQSASGKELLGGGFQLSGPERTLARPPADCCFTNFPKASPLGRRPGSLVGQA